MDVAQLLADRTENIKPLLWKRVWQFLLMTTLWHSHSTQVHTGEMKICVHKISFIKRYFIGILSFIGIIIHKNQKLEANQMSLHLTEDIRNVYPHNGVLLGNQKKNKSLTQQNGWTFQLLFWVLIQKNTCYVIFFFQELHGETKTNIYFSISHLCIPLVWNLTSKGTKENSLMWWSCSNLDFSMASMIIYIYQKASK